MGYHWKQVFVHPPVRIWAYTAVPADIHLLTPEQHQRWDAGKEWSPTFSQYNVVEAWFSPPMPRFLARLFAADWRILALTPDDQDSELIQLAVSFQRFARRREAFEMPESNPCSSQGQRGVGTLGMGTNAMGTKGIGNGSGKEF